MPRRSTLIACVAELVHVKAVLRAVVKTAQLDGDRRQAAQQLASNINNRTQSSSNSTHFFATTSRRFASLRAGLTLMMHWPGRRK